MESIDNIGFVHAIKSLCWQCELKSINEYHKGIEAILFETEQKITATKDYGATDNEI